MHALRKPVVDFGQCLRQILESKNTSASELARMMNYKSRNTVFRILSGEGGYSVLKAFYDRLLQEDQLSLHEKERVELHQALNVSRVGVENYKSYCMLAELLGETHAEDALAISWETESSDIADIDAVIRECREAVITITGCCDRQLFERFRRSMIGLSKKTKLTIAHFIYTGAEEVIRNISAIQPLFFESCYTPYALEPDMFSPEKERLYRSNCVFVHAVDAEGKGFDQAFLLVDKGVFCAMGRRAPGGFRLLQTFFGEDELRMYPLKKSFTQANGVQKYADYIDECARLERGRSIYNIRQDVPISFVHPDILVSAVTEGFRNTGFAEEAELEAILPALYEVQLSRYRNFFEKRRPTHTIFSYEAMERYARTGEQSDHFFAMRPFTGEERVRILSHLREQTQSNPQFKIYFFCKRCTPPKMEIGLYEGAGVLLAKPHTDYNLSRGHAEAIVDQKALCERFREFFMQYLLEDYVMSSEETLMALDNLIRIAQEAKN